MKTQQTISLFCFFFYFVLFWDPVITRIYYLFSVYTQMFNLTFLTQPPVKVKMTVGETVICSLLW